MVTGLLVLLVCQILGELLVRITGVVLPGPVVGLVLFWGLLLWRRPGDRSPLVRSPEALLRWLPLLYVPAGVGVVAHLSDLRDDAVPVVAALALSWLAGLAVTAAVMQATLRIAGDRETSR